VATPPGKRAIGDPDLRDRLYELLEHDHLPYSLGSRFVRLIVAIIVVDVLAAILTSVPEFDARLNRLFTTIEVGAVVAFALEYAARIWTVVGHSLRDMTPGRARMPDLRALDGSVAKLILTLPDKVHRAFELWFVGAGADLTQFPA
jgi:voltage-gated potassium channel